MITLAGLTFGIIEGPRLGWTAAGILGSFAAVLVAVPCLVLYERHRDEPLLDIRFFHSVPFNGAIVTAVCGFAALGGFLFLNTLYLQSVRHFSPLHAGLLTLPMAFVTGVFSPISGRVVAARGPRLPLLLSGIGIAVSGVMLSQVTDHTAIWYLVIAYAVFGFGFGILNAPITNSAASGMPRSQAGVAAAIASTSRQTGAALGVAVLGAVVTSRIKGSFANGFSSASHLGWDIMTGCGVAVFILGMVTTSAWARRTATEAAKLIEAAQKLDHATADYAGVGSRNRWLMTVVTPSPRIETPYSASAISIVGFWWVMTISWLVSRSSSKMPSSPTQVRVVECRFDLVHHVERARSSLEDRNQQSQRRQRSLATRQQRQPLDLLARRSRFDIDARVQHVVRIGQDQPAFAAREQPSKHALELARSVFVRRREYLLHALVDLAHDLHQVLAAALQILELLAQESVPLFECRELLECQRVDSAQQRQRAFS